MSDDTPYPPHPGQPQPGPDQHPTQEFPAQPQYPTQQYPAQQQPTQQYPAQQPYPGPAPVYPPPQPPAGQGGQDGGNRQLAIVGGAVLATAVLVAGLIFAVQALGGGKDAATAKPAASVVPTAPASVAPTPTSTPAATPTPSATASTPAFPKGYVVSVGDAFGFQRPAGWAVKADANSKFFRDAPIIETAQNNVTYWNNPTSYPTETGFSVTDLSSTPNNPADFVNALASSTTQRPVCANYLGYAVPFSRGDWDGQKLDSGICSDTKGRAVLIAATRRSDGAKLGLLIRGPEPLGATENQAMNVFDTHRH